MGKATKYGNHDWEVLAGLKSVLIACRAINDLVLVLGGPVVYVDHESCC